LERVTDFSTHAHKRGITIITNTQKLWTMLIVYIAVGAFLVGGGIVLAENFSSQKGKSSYR